MRTAARGLPGLGWCPGECRPQSTDGKMRDARGRGLLAEAESRCIVGAKWWRTASRAEQRSAEQSTGGFLSVRSYLSVWAALRTSSVLRQRVALDLPSHSCVDAVVGRILTSHSTS